MKYYNISKILAIMLLLGLLVCPASASILTSSANPTHILKCGESTISATFSDAGITTVNITLASVKPVMPMIPGSGRTQAETQTTVVPMTWNGTYWVGTFGDDSNLLWGERNIVYSVTNGTGTYTYNSGTKVFVYSDKCAGTGITNYTQMNLGIGNYTNLLAAGMNPISWGIYIWLQMFGYMFYVVIMFMICITIYMKTENIMHVLFASIFMILVGTSTVIFIPEEFRTILIMVLGLLIGIIFYRLFVRD